MSVDKRQRGDLTQGAVWKVILTFAFPLLIGNLLLQAYHLTDSILVGQFLGKEALAAVSASFFIYYFIISLVIGVGSGISVIVSQYYGAKRYEQVQRAFSSFFIFMFISGIVLSVAGILFAESFFRWTQTPAEVIPPAVRYFRIYIAGTLFFITFNSIISILRGIGDSTRPMYFILATAALNVLLDLLFILLFRWGVAGAAWATVASQAVGMGVALSYVSRRHQLLSLRRRDMVFDRKLFVQGLKIGLPTGIQQCSIALGLIALLGVVNRFGTDTLTAYGAAGKIDSLITQAILTLSGALAAFCGQNIGARRLDRVRKGVRFAMTVNLAFCLLTFAAIYCYGKQIMWAFTPDESVQEIGYEYLLIIGGFFVVHGALNVFNGALRGAGDTLFIMLTGVVSFWLARIPLAYWLSDLWGQRGVWWAINISVAFGLAATAIYYKTGRWKKRRITGRK
jgi:putative MATE family efflux protein